MTEISTQPAKEGQFISHSLDIGQLTEMQSAFCYAAVGQLLRGDKVNAAEAARLAGYRGDYSGQRGAQLYNNELVQRRIQELLDIAKEKSSLTEDRVLQETARLAFFNAKDYYHDDGRPKLVSELTRAQAAAIVAVQTTYDDQGKVIDHAFRFADKKPYIDLLGRYFKTWESRGKGFSRKRSIQELAKLARGDDELAG